MFKNRIILVLLLVFSSFGFSQPNDYPKLNVDVYGGVIGGDIERKPLVSHVAYPKFPLSFGGRTEIRLSEEVGIGGGSLLQTGLSYRF